MKSITEIFKNFIGMPVQQPSLSIPESSLKIKLRHKAFLKIRYYTQKIEIEWGGLLVLVQKGNEIIVEDVIFIPQTATHGNFNHEMTKLSAMLEKMATTKPEILPKLKGWVHSHNSMGVFWSDEDKDTFRQLCDYFGDYVVGGVVNKAGEQLWRIEIKDKNFGRLIIDNVKPEYIVSDPIIEKECREDIKTNLKKRW